MIYFSIYIIQIYQIHIFRKSQNDLQQIKDYSHTGLHDYKIFKNPYHIT